MAITFFCLRTAPCLYFSITAIQEAPYDYDGDVVVPCSIFAAFLGAGALTDLLLAFGAKTKTKWPFYVWNCTTFILGGLICCIAIPLVTLKALKEIDEMDQGNEPKPPNEISNQMNDLQHI